MSDAPEPTLRDVMDQLGRIDRRLAENSAQIRELRDRMDRVDERLDRIDGRLAENSAQIRELRDRMDSLEQGVANVLRDGFARVEGAVRSFAETKADRSEVAALRADVDALKEAAG